MNKPMATAEFSPNKSERMAKARLKKALEDAAALIDPTKLSLAEMARIANSPCIEKSASKPGFIGWLLDEDTTALKIKALEELALEKLEEILHTEISAKGAVQAKDALKAIEMLLQLSNRFPAKNKEVRFLDKSLETMDEKQVKAETQRLQRKLAAVSEGEQ